MKEEIHLQNSPNALKWNTNPGITEFTHRPTDTGEGIAYVDVSTSTPAHIHFPSSAPADKKLLGNGGVQAT